MKKTLHIDEHLLSEARRASGAASDTETVRRGLQALVRQAAYERLRALRVSGGSPRTSSPALVSRAALWTADARLGQVAESLGDLHPAASPRH